MNRILASHDALAALLTATFPDARAFRNPDGAAAFAATDFVCALNDDEEPEVLAVLSGPIYDLKAEATVTLARKTSEIARRAESWADVDRLHAALNADPSLGGVVEDARIAAVAEAEMDRARWIGGGREVTVRLLFFAPSPAG